MAQSRENSLVKSVDGEYTQQLDRQAKYTVDRLLEPIKEDSPCGESLRYDPLYDKIREARREDDSTLSRGIWQYDLKRADWFEVEKLAGDALAHRSKDLQIAGWIGEAWVMMGGLAGIRRSMELIQALSEKFWPCLYPEMEDEEMEYRAQFFDWYDQNLSQRFVALPLVEGDFVGIPFTLAEWMSAVRFEAAIKRSPDSAKLRQRAEAKGQVSLKRFQAVLKQLPKGVIEGKLDLLRSVFQRLQELGASLDRLMAQNPVAFHQFKPVLEEMIRIYKTELDQRPSVVLSPPPPPQELGSIQGEAEILPPETDEIVTQETLSHLDQIPSKLIPQTMTREMTRERAYQELLKITDFFQKTEPQNPAIPILQRLISWQNKSLAEIFSEMGSAPEEILAFIKLMGVTENKDSS